MIEHSGTSMLRRQKTMLRTSTYLAALIAALPAVQAQAQQAAQTPEVASTGGDIIVTASRREQRVTDLPFNISAYGGEQIERANITDVASLTRQVPNFNIIDTGAATAASQIPIIRGLNASQPTANAARYFQSPVGFYLGNAPITGSLPLFDISRVEVLRGPQGTLYGAGSLAGAVRIVPTDPKLGEVSGLVTASVGTVAHSGDPAYSFGGVINLPVGDTLALRASVKHEHEAGFIDAHDILKRQGDNYVNGTPELADPTNVANSPGVYFNKKDYNSADTTSARVAVIWKPTNEFTLNIGYNYVTSKGVGGNFDNPSYGGGPSPIDPRIIQQPTGDYELSKTSLEPWDRRTQLATVDASYDMGFATVSTTLAYGKNKGQVLGDSTAVVLGIPTYYYYTGIPANPRTVIPFNNTYNDRSFTEELRIVSKAGKLIDYTAGVFLQQQKKVIGLIGYAPGASDQSFASGGNRIPIFQNNFPPITGGSYVPSLSDGRTYQQITTQRFREVSLYGDVTLHVTDKWSLTGGARVFWQRFSSDLDSFSVLFAFPGQTVLPLNSASSTKGSDKIFKVNTSYKLGDNGQVYATWSQGFRRGGSNTFIAQGVNPFIFEPEALRLYKPDRTNNFEIGIKGSKSRIYYSISGFYIIWNNPQIDVQTPYNLFPVVINGAKATSKGFEAELSGPIAFDGLSFNLGLAYSHAQLTRNYGLPAGDGAGGIVPNAIMGVKGDPLPGSPDWSGAGSLTYEQKLSKGALTYNLGFDFRSGTWNQLPHQSTNTLARKSPGYIMFSGSIGYAINDWNLEFYGTNLLDKRAVYAANLRTSSSVARLGDWSNAFAVSRPRELGIRLTRKW